ncbi:MAG: 5'-methylthioadenosine/S-adenosylhomocysteine nucleosidase [Hyphomicrobiales bacterium]
MKAPALEIINGKTVLFIMAVPMEYGDALKSRITPLMCGVGPVEAALVTGQALMALAHQNITPAVIVSLGSAGSATLEQGEVYQAASVSYRDMDASPLGFTKGVTPFIDHPVDLPLLCPLQDVPKAKLSTGANIVSGDAYKTIDADMVDMETFAIKRAADTFEVPLIGLRGISDGKEELSKYGDWADYLADIDVKLAASIDKLEKECEL